MSERRIIVIGNHETYFGKHGTLQHELNGPGKANIVNLDGLEGIAPVFMTEELMLEADFDGTLPEAVNVVLQEAKPEGYVPERIVLPKAAPGKRGRKQTTFDITPEIVDNALVLAKKEGKGLVEIAKILNVNPMKLSNALEGMHTFKRGRKPKQTPSVEAEGELVPA
jgi:hypothetical protein